MQERCLQGDWVHPEVGKDGGHGHGVLDEVLAREPLLPPVGRLGEGEGAVKVLQVDLGVARPKVSDQEVE